GRIAVALRTEKTQLLLDYGILMGRPPGFPMHIPPKEVDAIILCHSHLDHSGAVPVFHIQEEKTVYGTQLCFDITELLIADLIHLTGYYLPDEYI
ncbi:MAG: MBL fold metallo-hydrolase, partial [Candidatus Korarchaeota archaeon]|nr:MBL fold metallo-hydrolase [Candidatus Thorarchaeota archaeon]NIW52631.1 MBL fold metallo-hydrolase [Candidatus Korarchaeota archaeon]